MGEKAERIIPILPITKLKKIILVITQVNGVHLTTRGFKVSAFDLVDWQDMDQLAQQISDFLSLNIPTISDQNKTLYMIAEVQIQKLSCSRKSTSLVSATNGILIASSQLQTSCMIATVLTGCARH